MKPHVQILVGPIASGKSTYAKNCAKAGFVIVNDDAIVNAVHGGDYTLYDKSLKPLYKTVENTIVTTAIGLGKSVVVDRGTNNRSSSRRRWVGLAHSLDVSAQCILFDDDGPEVHARRRSESDGRGHGYDYWLKVAQHHRKHFEQPSFAEGFDGLVLMDWKLTQDGHYCK